VNLEEWKLEKTLGRLAIQNAFPNKQNGEQVMSMIFKKAVICREGLLAILLRPVEKARMPIHYASSQL
jgi:hypothetical protein